MRKKNSGTYETLSSRGKKKNFSKVPGATWSSLPLLYLVSHNGQIFLQQEEVIKNKQTNTQYSTITEANQSHQLSKFKGHCMFNTVFVCIKIVYMNF